MKKSVFGILLMMEGLFVLSALLVSLYYFITEGEDDWWSLALTAGVCFGVGGVSKLMVGHDKDARMSRADSFLIVALSWVVFSAIGMIPYIVYLKIDPASAFFEAMSGFTTTGATVLSGLDTMPHGILFWRSLTQWMGGLGIVVFSFALIPVYDLKNSNIFSAEVTGLGLDKLRPKIGSTARRLLIIYMVLTGMCAAVYWIGPMNFYDAVCHALTTIATGGFSTHDKSIAHFDSPFIEWTSSAFMVAASINFSLYYYLSVRRPKVMFRNEEMLTFFAIVIVSIAFFVGLFYYVPVLPGSEDTIPQQGWDTVRTAVFHVSTIISSTGFAGKYCDYVAWGGVFSMATVVIGAIGACAGSTAGGIKVVRIIVCAKSVMKEFLLQLHPRAVKHIKVSGQVVEDSRVRRALAFIFIYMMMVIVAMLVFGLLGLDAETSIGSSISMLSNIGPGTGSVGPTSNFMHVHPVSKMLMSFYMLVGRLEIYTVLFLFMPSFWSDRK